MSECKAEVWADTNFPRKRQCRREATRDGYCTQHHPENVRKRSDERSQKLRDIAMRSQTNQTMKVLGMIALNWYRENRDDPEAIVGEAINWFRTAGYRRLPVRKIK